MKTNILCVGTAVAAMLLAACRTSPSSTPAPPLTDTEWRLIELDGKPVAKAEGLKPPTLTLAAESKRAAGFSGINRYSGSYELDGNTLKFGMFMSTRMAGPPEAMVVEDTFLKAMAQVKTWKIQGGKLSLLGGSGVLLRFEPSP